MHQYLDSYIGPKRESLVLGIHLSPCKFASLTKRTHTRAERAISFIPLRNNNVNLLVQQGFEHTNLQSKFSLESNTSSICSGLSNLVNYAIPWGKNCLHCYFNYISRRAFYNNVNWGRTRTISESGRSTSGNNYNIYPLK